MIFERAKESFELFVSARAESRTLRTQLRDLDDMMLWRHEGFRKIRESVARRVQNAFHVLLVMRNYGGRLEFNHKEGQLEVSVDPEGESYLSNFVQ